MLQPSRGKVVTLISNVPQTIHTITSNKNGQEFNKNLKIMTRATKAQLGAIQGFKLFMVHCQSEAYMLVGSNALKCFRLGT
jgi:hypothetical protein